MNAAESETTVTRVAAVQMVSSGQLLRNLEKAGALIAQAAGQGAALVVLPENFAVFPVENSRVLGAAEATPDGQIRSFLREQARTHGIWLVGGSVPVLDDAAGGVVSACFVLNPQGEEVGRYDKMHLFDVEVAGDTQSRYRESDDFVPGDSLLVIRTPFCQLGVIVCYDLRFPEMIRAMALQGMDLLAVPAAFTATTGRAHWKLLLRARAVENLCWVVAANQGGTHPGGRQTWGHSMVVEPWGRVAAACEMGEGVVFSEVDPARAAQHRAQFPVLSHVRMKISGSG